MRGNPDTRELILIIALVIILVATALAAFYLAGELIIILS